MCTKKKKKREEPQASASSTLLYTMCTSSGGGGVATTTNILYTEAGAMDSSRRGPLEPREQSLEDKIQVARVGLQQVIIFLRIAKACACVCVFQRVKINK